MFSRSSTPVGVVAADRSLTDKEWCSFGELPSEGYDSHSLSRDAACSASDPAQNDCIPAALEMAIRQVADLGEPKKQAIPAKTTSDPAAKRLRNDPYGLIGITDALALEGCPCFRR